MEIGNPLKRVFFGLSGMIMIYLAFNNAVKMKGHNVGECRPPSPSFMVNSFGFVGIF
jgi:hypothetical protein